MQQHDEPSGLPGLTRAEEAELFDGANALAAFAGSRGKPKLREEDLVTSQFELTTEHLAIAEHHVVTGATLDSQAPTLKAIRHTHHRLAQLLANGVDESKAAVLCNYSVSRVSILKSDPAFIELLSYYSDKVEDQWTDFVSVAAGLSLDFMQELQKRLDESPEQFSASSIMDAVKLLADRSGHAPVSKTQNVNINVNMGDKLRAARERANAMLIEGTIL